MKIRAIGTFVGLASCLLFQTAYAQTPLTGAGEMSDPSSCAALGEEINALNAAQQKLELEAAQKAPKSKPTALGGLGGSLLMKGLGSGDKKDEAARKSQAKANQLRIDSLTAQYAQKNC